MKDTLNFMSSGKVQYTKVEFIYYLYLNKIDFAILTLKSARQVQMGATMDVHVQCSPL